MKTLNLMEAAAFLHVHYCTLAARAKAGEIPGAKIGRAWVFIDDDLAEYVRAKYAAQRQALQEGGIKCQDTKGKAYTGRRDQVNSSSALRTTENEYSNLLAPQTKN